MRQNLSHKLAITTVHSREFPVECCTCYLPLSVVTATSMWIPPPKAIHVLFCCVFLTELGFLPSDLGLTPTLPLSGERTLTQVTLSITRNVNLTRRQSITLSYANKKELRQIFMIMVIGTSYQMGLPHQTV